MKRHRAEFETHAHDEEGDAEQQTDVAADTRIAHGSRPFPQVRGFP